jgi:hypothetical protein
VGKRTFIIANIFVLSLFASAEASITGKLVKLALKPVTIPLGFITKKAIQTVSGTANAGLRVAKASLANVSIQAGPIIKIRPFDFRRI